MGEVIGLIVALAALGALGPAAWHWGVDSRDGIHSPEWERRTTTFAAPPTLPRRPSRPARVANTPHPPTRPSRQRFERVRPRVPHTPLPALSTPPGELGPA